MGGQVRQFPAQLLQGRFSIQSNIHLMVFLYGMILISALWLQVWFGVDREYQAEMKNAERENTNLAKTFEEHLRRVILETDYHVLNVARVYAVSGANSQSVAAHLSNARSSSVVGQMEIANSQGKVVGTAIPVRNPPDLTGKDYFYFHKFQNMERLFLGRPDIDKEGNGFVLPISRRVELPDGVFGGVVVGVLSIDYLSNYFAKIEPDREKTIMILGMDGIVRIRQEKNGYTSGYNLGAGLLQHAREHPFGSLVFVSPVDGIERILSYRVLPEYSLIVSVGVSTKAVLAGYTERKWKYIGYASLATLFIAAFCILLLQKVTQQRVMQQKLQDANSELAHSNRQLEWAKEKLEKIVFIDPLTGAWNRRGFERAARIGLRRALQHKQPFSLIMFDVDYFKRINDQFGHLTGDAVLIELVKILQEHIRETDFLARLGGEEFMLIVPHLTLCQAEDVAWRMIRSISQHVFAEVGRVTLSGGVAEYQTGENLESLVHRVDKALYAAKTAGRNTIKRAE